MRGLGTFVLKSTEENVNSPYDVTAETQKCVTFESERYDLNLKLLGLEEL
jgi:hypothetical protein